MASASAAGGSLAQGTLVRLLGRFYGEKATGVLEVEHDGGLSRAFFRAGYPAGANVFAKFKPLGRFLLDIGWIDFETLNRSLEEVAKNKRPQGEVLVELGALTREKLSLGLRRQLLANLVELMQIVEGKWRFDADAPPTWTEDLAVSPHEAVLRFLAAPEGADAAKAIVGDLGDGPLVLGDLFDRERKRFDLTSGDQKALDGLRSPASLETVRAAAGLPPGRLEAVVGSLSVFDLVTGAGGGGGSGGARSDAGASSGGGASSSGSGASSSGSGASSSGSGASSAGGGSAAGAKPAGASGDTRSRRSRLLKRAFQNIPGAQVMNRDRRPQGGVETPAPGGAQAPGPGGSKAPPAGEPASGGSSARERAAELEAQALLREIDVRHAAIAKEDFYRRLGLTSSAPLPKVKTAYLLLAKKYHPDRVKVLGLPETAAEKLREVFEAVHEAYETLSDPKARTDYDKLLADEKVKGDRNQARRLAEAKIQFKKGEALFKKKDYAGALGYLEPAAKVDPDNGAYLVALAWSKFNVGPAAKVATEVRRLLKQATRVEGAKDQAHYYLGLLARMNDRLDEAVTHFESAIKLNKHLTEAVSELRVIRRRMEKQETSTTGKFFRKVLGKD